MSKVCELTQRRPCKGRSYTTRGIAKKKKGIGIKITGKTKVRFEPNLQKKRFWDEESKTFITLRVSTAAIRTIEKKGLQKAFREARRA
ncbi:MAG: 50S ribosomal protein L28 [Chlamydiia bacterium]|jgi:large subunit ribosomal protein L28|nr:50S ribosomal protein L28 [Chlamydiota bacterium]